MSEKLPTESVPSQEALRFEIGAVTSDNMHELEAIRRKTDDNIDERKFRHELEHYGIGGEQIAFLIRDKNTAVGFVEIDAVAGYVPKGAERDLCDDKETFDNLKDWARIGRISLLEEYRGHKIGNTLLNYAEEWARAHGQSVIWLDYLASNTKLEKFYTGAGYNTLMDFKDGGKDRLRRIAVKKF